MSVSGRETTNAVAVAETAQPIPGAAERGVTLDAGVASRDDGTPSAAAELPRVLMALPDKRVRGGPPSHLYLLYDSLRELGVDVRSFVYGGRTHDETRVGKVLGRLYDLVRFPLLIARHCPAVVQLNSAFDRKGVLRDFFFVPVGRLLGRRIITKFHGSDLTLLDRRSMIWSLLVRTVIRGSDLICVLNREEQRTFASRFPGTPVVLVKNALDFDRYRTKEDFRRHHGIPRDKPLLLFIGRFIAAKGLDVVISALPLIRRRHDVHAVFVGDGPVAKENKDLCRRMGLSPYVTFTGYLPEAQTTPAYLASEILVFPTSHSEGMPMVIWHSLACGLPVITTRIRAAADWLEDGKHCLFVPPGDPQRLAEAVVRLLESPGLRESLARNGRECARRFDRRLVAEEYCALYERLSRRSTAVAGRDVARARG